MPSNLTLRDLEIAPKSESVSFAPCADIGNLQRDDTDLLSVKRTEYPRKTRGQYWGHPRKTVAGWEYPLKEIVAGWGTFLSTVNISVKLPEPRQCLAQISSLQMHSWPVTVGSRTRSILA